MRFEVDTKCVLLVFEVLTTSTTHNETFKIACSMLLHYIISMQPNNIDKIIC